MGGTLSKYISLLNSTNGLLLLKLLECSERLKMCNFKCRNFKCRDAIHTRQNGIMLVLLKAYLERICGATHPFAEKIKPDLEGSMKMVRSLPCGGSGLITLLYSGAVRVGLAASKSGFCAKKERSKTTHRVIRLPTFQWRTWHTSSGGASSGIDPFFGWGGGG